jgi:hypothetical protein
MPEDVTDVTDEPRTAEMAPATSVRVLETNILHASDVIYWLDGTSAEDEADMQRIQRPLEVAFTEKPRSIQVLQGAGKTALWRTPEEPMIEGRATEVERARPAQADFVVAGRVRDTSGRFNPRRFERTLGDGTGAVVVLYPSLPGTASAVGGSLFGAVRWADTERALPWALLELVVEVSTNNTLTFRAQANAKGDFKMALTRLPPLPESASEYTADLRILAGDTANAEEPSDPDTFTEVELESTSAGDAFATTLPLTIRAGEIKRINSFNKTYIAAQTV